MMRVGHQVPMYPLAVWANNLNHAQSSTLKCHTVDLYAGTDIAPVTGTIEVDLENVHGNLLANYCLSRSRLKTGNVRCCSNSGTSFATATLDAGQCPLSGGIADIAKFGPHAANDHKGHRPVLMVRMRR